MKESTLYVLFVCFECCKKCHTPAKTDKTEIKTPPAGSIPYIYSEMICR